MLKRILLCHDASLAPIMTYLSTAFERQGICACCFDSSLYTTWIDKVLFKFINKQAHNFRILPKSANFFENSPWNHQNYRSRKLKERIDQFQPDLLLVIRGTTINREVIEAVPCRMAWWVEGDDRYDEAQSELPWFQHYFFLHKTLAVQAQQEGYSASHLAHAVDLDVFKPLPGAPEYDVGFVGAWSQQRAQYMLDALQVTNNIAIFGPRWLRRAWRKPKLLRAIKGSYLPAQKLSAFYNACKIVINLTQWGTHAGIRSGMTMRVFEVPASGRLLLTDSSKETEEALKDGQNVAIFHNRQEFIEKLKCYLNDDELRERVAAQGHQKIISWRTYDLMAQEIIDTYRRIIQQEGVI
ncbi:MAG: glycosyltransferase [Pseudomonadales bacterium]|nr:glycosyltransferase [Pseudomonadales bacterium]